MRNAVATAVACLITIGVALADPAQASAKRHTDIPEQNLGDALRALAQDRGIQLVYLSDSVETLHTAGAVGDFTVEEALSQLLSGSGLHYKYVDAQTVSIMPHATSSEGRNAPAAESGTVLDEIVVSAQKREERLQDVPVPVSAINAERLVDNGRVSLKDYYARVPGLSLAPNYLAEQRLSIRGITRAARIPPSA